MAIVKPFLKWVGGKTQIIETILSQFPKEIENYHEPFLGGGSVLLGVLSHIKSSKIILKGKIYASDINHNLISLYKVIQKSPAELILEVKQITAEFGQCKNTEVNRKATTLEEALTSPESYYFWTRTRYNALTKDERTTPHAAAMLLFMNKTCFRGVYREGPKGFNVPYGNYKNPTILEEGHIHQISEMIKCVEFTCISFTESITNTKVLPGDFVYLDPPYAPETGTSFVSYTADGFNAEHHAALFKICNTLHTLHIKFMMSNADVQIVKTAFPVPQYTTSVILCKRSINSKNPESKTNEVLIKNY